jgi:hypothetical protein
VFVITFKPFIHLLDFSINKLSNKLSSGQSGRGVGGAEALNTCGGVAK